MSELARGKPSKVRLFETVKKMESPTLTQLSNEMGISKTAILKQVNLLEKDGVISRTYVSTGKGRPVCKVNVTNRSYDQLQDTYRSIAEDALSYVEEKFGCTLINEIMATRNIRLVNKYRLELQDTSWELMLKRFEEMRNTEGYLAEISQWDDGTIEIAEFNCPLMRIAEKYHDACEYEKKFFQEIFHMEVIKMTTVLENTRACRFVLKERE